MNDVSLSLSAAFSLIASFDDALWEVVARSLWVSGMATLLASGIGVLLGAWLAVARFAGRGVVLAMLNTLLAIPSVVVGLLVYVMLSRSGPLGYLGWLFSVKAMIMAQTLLILPIVVALTRQLVGDADALHGEQLQSMGASCLMRAVLHVCDARYAVVMVLLAAFGRAIAEVGAVMVVGGNIEGFTRVMTTTIALETSKGDLPLALGLGFVLLSVVLVLNGMVALVRRSIELSSQGTQAVHGGHV